MLIDVSDILLPKGRSFNDDDLVGLYIEITGDRNIIKMEALNDDDLVGLYIEITRGDRNIIKMEALKRNIPMKTLILSGIQHIIVSTSDNPYLTEEE